MAVWKKREHNLEWLPDKLKQLKTLGGGDLLERFQLEAVVLTMLEFEPDVPEPERQGFVRQAIIAAEQAGKYTPGYVLGEVTRREKNFLALPRRQFVLATHISLQPTALLPTFRLDGATFTFNYRLPRRFSAARSPLTPGAEQYLRDGLTDGRYQAVRVTLTARTPEEANEQAQRRLNLLCALLNFPLNDTRMLQDRLTFGLRKPVNRIRAGNMYTIHDPNGRLAREHFWYDPQAQRVESPKPLKDKDRYLRTVHDYRDALNTSRYREFLVHALVRYTAALDRADYDASFFKLWSLLEHLTVVPRADYDKLVKRVTFIFDEPEYHRGILTHLRSRRNQAVHNDDQTDTSQTLMLQAKFYVHALLRLHLFHRPRFRSPEEVAAFLDLPPDSSGLRAKVAETANRQRLLAYALRIKAPKRGQPE